MIGARPQFIKYGPVTSIISFAGGQEFMAHINQQFNDKVNGDGD